MQDTRSTIVERLFGRVSEFWRLPRRQFWRETLTLSAVALIILLIEMLGRWNRSEFFDAASCMVLLLCVAMVFSWHRRLRLRWTRRFQSTLRAAIAYAGRWRFEWGLDLRREPVVPRGCPPLLIGLPLILLALSLAAVTWSGAVGAPVRGFAVPVSYVAYSIGLLILWSGLLAVIIVAAFLPAWTILDMIKSHTNLSLRKANRVGTLLTLVYFAAVLAAALWLPNWVATVMLAIIAVFAFLLPWISQTWYPDCLWRSRSNRDECEVRSMSLGTLFSLQLFAVTLIPLTLVLFALGPNAVNLAPGFVDSPISGSLGRLSAWLASGGLIVFLGLLTGHLSVARRHDPARHAPTSIHVIGVDDSEAQRRIQDVFARLRWPVRFAPHPAERCDVKLQISESPSRAADTDAPNGSMVVSASDLETPELQQRIARRDVIQRRRVLVRGLESIFRRAASRKDRSGSGYWVAPHYWFVDGLTRDQFDDEETNMLDVIPPLYYKAFPRAARHHFFQVCRALEIDLIYVEDGINFRNLRRVLRVLFERFDIDGGRQPLSDVHFAGLPKVRVMLHNYDFEAPPLKTKYPEPDYQHLGRVRILHVFKDRGDEEEQVDVPEAPDWLCTPDDAPVLIG